MLDWTRKHCDALVRRMEDIGTNDCEASERLREFEEFSATAGVGLLSRIFFFPSSEIVTCLSSS